MKLRTLLLTLPCLCWFGAIASGQTWNLVWSDEFTGPAINSSDWTFDFGGSGWGNGELEYYTNRAVNAVVNNDNLLIIARREALGGNSYTSARLKTQGLQSFMYGRVEARIKLPSAQGLWPAFWMMGTSFSQVGWPKCGEIDIMEHVSNDPHVYGTMHWDNGGHSQYGGSTLCDVTTYHVYSVEWNADAIIWSVDSVPYWTGNIANNINSTDEFHAPFFIILNLAVGGAWPGFPDATTPFPDTMFVDYVRVYQLSTDVHGSPDRTPNESRLEQNYPNPFNPTTRIRYQIAPGPTGGSGAGESTMVTLVVYDALGREAAVLVQEKQRPGEYSVLFDGSGLASGAYLCRLTTGSHVESREMILLR